MKHSKNVEQCIVVSNYDTCYIDKIDILCIEPSIMLMKQNKGQNNTNPASTCPKLSFHLDNISDRAHSYGNAKFESTNVGKKLLQTALRPNNGF